MTAWHKNARFHLFADKDVFIEDDHYLYVKNQAFNYFGDYICREYRLIENSKGETEYLVGDQVGADNEYIVKLEKAPRNIACDIICADLNRWAKIEEEFEEEFSDDDYFDYDATNSELIYDAIDYLKTYGYDENNEQFTYC